MPDGPAVARGPADDTVEAIIAARFEAIMEACPVMATGYGIHAHDGRLPDLSRSAKEADMAAEDRFVADLLAVDPDHLSEPVRFEREVALHAARLRSFEDEVVQGWRRRTSAAEEIGAGLFLLLSRDFAPMGDRLASMSARMEAVPLALEQVRDRLGERPVRLWLGIEQRRATNVAPLIDQIVAVAGETWPSGASDLSRLVTAAEEAKAALDGYAAWVDAMREDGVDDVALGAEHLDGLIERRAFDGLTTDAILAIGWQQLAAMHEERVAAGREIDPRLDEAGVLDRVKRDGPPDFEAALEAYRAAMHRARDHVRSHDLATLPDDDVLEVLATPVHMRSTIPLAAYFGPAAFDRPMRGVYIVTPSVDGDPGAMREHNWSGIVNTSVHEAYPGHHHQLSAALSTPTPARLLVDAPEFVEGWGMYCERMMLEQGFEATPERRVIVATDAIWRAARIILDIQLHRGEIDVEGAVAFLIEHTGFEPAVARAEIHRYTQTPTYNLSYLLGKVLIERLRDDEEARLGASFSLKAYHDALLYSGSLPISFHRRLLAGEGGGPTRPGVDGGR